MRPLIGRTIIRPTYFGACHPLRLAMVPLAVIYVAFAALNATFTLDDPGQIDHFASYLKDAGWLSSLKVLLLGLDLNGEYRLYGLSRIFHLALWTLFGKHAAPYVATIAVLQLATGYGIYLLLGRMRFDTTQAGVVALMWVLSPFAATSCFHHYSYLILPYSLAVACTLVMQQLHDGAPTPASYFFLTVLGTMMAWFGEAHLIASLVLMAFVSLGTPSQRSRRQRFVDVSVPIAAITGAILIHRWAWINLAVVQQTPDRFRLSPPTGDLALEQVNALVHALVPGLAAQLHPLVAMAGIWILSVAALITATVVVAGRRQKVQGATTAGGRAGVLPLGLLILLTASLAIYGGIWVLTPGNHGDVLNRRYGFMPNTIFLMLIASFFAEPWLRRIFKAAPAVICSIVIGFWFALEAICLPSIRAQDRTIADAIRDSSRKVADPTLVFMNAWSHPDDPTYLPTGGTPGIRGDKWPEIFETPFSFYWVEASYADVILGLHKVSYAAQIKDDGAFIQVFNWPKVPVMIPTESLILVLNGSSVVPWWKQPLAQVSVTHGLDAVAVLQKQAM